MTDYTSLSTQQMNEEYDSLAFDNTVSASNVITHYGLRNQEEKLIEEIGELIQAIFKNRFKHSDSTEANYFEEYVDVQFLLRQIAVEKGYSAYDIEKQMQKKAERTLSQLYEKKAEEMTFEQLKAIRDNVTECNDCGFCANVYPSKAEMLDIINELMQFKFNQCL